MTPRPALHYPSLVVIALAVTLVHAAPVRAGGPEAQNGRLERTEQTTERIALGANGRLELRNVSGDITVTAGKGSEVVLEITKRSRARNEADAVRGLKEVNVVVTHRGDRATVETTYPRGRNPFDVTTIYNVTAPAGIQLAVHSVSGNVGVTGITGDVVVEAVSGNATVRNAGAVSRVRAVSGDIHLEGISTSGEVSAQSVSGSVTATNVKARRFAAENVSGDVRAQNISVDTVLLKSLSGDVQFDGALTPSGRYEFDSHSGNVRITVPAGAGFEFRATSFSGRVRPEGVSMQSMTANGGQVRATVGDGSAVVAARTFSGDVVIARR